MQKRNLKNRIPALILSLVMLLSVLTSTALAAVSFDANEPLSLTISCVHHGVAVKGTEFRLYKVADGITYETLKLTDDFKNYDISFESVKTKENMLSLAYTLSVYVQKDGVEPFDRGITDEHGTVNFPNEIKALSNGLYLVLGDSYTANGLTVTPEPFIITLPNQNEDGEWVYDVMCIPKSDSEENDGETVSRKVLKVWDDNDSSSRPSAITVELLQNGKVFDTVVLSEKDNWRYTWENLNPGYNWSVVEKNVPDGYKVLMSAEGTTFVITNSKTEKETTTTKPDTQVTTPQGGNKLPNTGLLWWPVPVCAFSGTLLFMSGWVVRRKNEDNEE